MNAKAASLLAGVCQQVALVLIIRYSKTTQHQQDEFYVPYLTSVAVMLAEVLKLCLSFILELITSSQSSTGINTGTVTGNRTCTRTRTAMDSIRRSWSIARALDTLERMMNLVNRESIKLIIPAALYLLQNNLLFVALSHLSVPTYQISSQGKLLATAIFSRLLLKKHLSAMQYCAIALLGLGVAVVQLSEYRINTSVKNHTGSTHGQQDQWLGGLAVLVSCLTSGFAGVYFELVLKRSTQSVHYHNFQLAFWSIIFAILLIICKDMTQVKSHGLFHGFDEIVGLIVVTQAMTGFAVSMMLKYANALLKGFAISVAAIVASVASVFLFDAKIDGIFFIGASMVGIAVKMYSAGKDHQHTSERRAFYPCTIKASFKSKMLLGLGLTMTALSVSQFKITSRAYIDNISNSRQPNYLDTSSTPATVTDISSTPATVTDVSSTPATVTDISSTPATVTNISSTPATVTDVSSTPATVTNTSSTPPTVTATVTIDRNLVDGSYFTSALNKTFWVPTDMQYLLKWHGMHQFQPNGGKVIYMRKEKDVVTRGKSENCAPTLDVLAWLMDQVNTKKGALMIAYGDLIHIHREKEFVNETTGKYIDDDIDLWASLETVIHVGQLEPELFSKFGWTVRLFVSVDEYVVLLQIVAACGHEVLHNADKAISSHPAIEIYPLPVVMVNGTLMAQDMWQDNRFLGSMVYPPEHITFNSIGTSHPLQLQLPREALKVMTCLYGNWTIPSKDHAPVSRNCQSLKV